MKVFIIGSGIAGLSAAEEMRKISETAEITIFTKEKQLPYYRLSLIRYLAGEVKKENMTIHPMEWYEERRIHIQMDTIVVEIKPDNHSVVLATGEELKYDKLVVATGAAAFRLPIPGNQLDNVLTIRNMEDIHYIMEKLTQIRHCVCIGGGIIGIEVASTIAKKGVKVTLIQNADRLMPTQLNHKAAMLLERFMEVQGISIRVNENVSSIEGDAQCERVVLETGETLEAQMVIMSAGIKPVSELAKNAGLDVGKGIVVDQFLRSSDKDIYCAGDMAEYNSRIYGLWSVSMAQGKIAGANAIGGESDFKDLLSSLSARVQGVDLFSIGEFIPREGAWELEKQTEESYMSVVLRDNRIIGGILVSKAGNKGLSAKLKQAVESKAQIDIKDGAQMESIITMLSDK